MIAVDTNILVYEHRSDSQWYGPASQLLRELGERTDDWAIPWPCISEFLAVVTNPRIYDPPTPLSDALIHVGSWLQSPTLVLLSEGPGFFATFRATLQQAAVVGGRVHDARIAALCVYHGVTALYTADRDFSRFARLRTENPLVRS